jgi:hypothetical protein
VGATATFLVLAPPPTTTGIPVVVLEPDTGEAGSTTMVSISGFTPDSTFEVHIGELGSRLLGSGISNAIGEGAVVVRLPDGVTEGEWTLGVCETQFVACNDWTSDFWVGASAGFNVTVPSPPTTTATEAPPATEAPAATEAPTATTEAPTATSTTTTVAADAPTVTTTTPAVSADEGIMALPILQQNAGDSGSSLWWFLLIFLGAVAIGMLLAWTLRDE